MTISIHWMAQLKQAAGVAAEQVEIAGACSVKELARLVADRHGDPLRRLLFNVEGALQPTNLFFIGDAQVQPTDLVKDGDTVTVLSPIAGG